MCIPCIVTIVSLFKIIIALNVQFVIKESVQPTLKTCFLVLENVFSNLFLKDL